MTAAFGLAVILARALRATAHPGVLTGRAAALLAAGLLAACGGGAGTAPAPAPAPAAERPAGAAPREAVEAIPPVRTDVEPEAILRAGAFGFDPDTVEAGAFDQGKMWTFEFPPAEYFAETYGFRPDPAWFEKARLGALRIPSCSASLVSPNGLVMTNHHCAREFVTQASGDGESLLDRGFYAGGPEEEREVADFHADQLVELIDVTDEVEARLDGVGEEERSEVRRDVLDDIEARLLEERGGEESGMVVEMVSLYNGGRTSAYVFRRYTRARLVMAPEVGIGFFGGDPDNFTYPRYNLDVSFFRLYDDAGRPLRNEVWFPVDDDGLEEGQPVFIVGNPGSTSRLQTVAELRFRRDVTDRAVLAALRSRMEVLDAYIRAHPAEAEERDLRNQYFSLSNSEKAFAGQIRGLEDPVILARRADTEADFLTEIEADSALDARYGGLVERMADFQERKRENADHIRAFAAFGSPALESATLIRGFWGLQLVSAVRGEAPPERMEDLMEGLKAVPQQPAGLDRALLAVRLRDLVEHLGPGSESVANVLAGRTPEEAARAIVEGSALSDSAAAVAAAEAGTLTPEDAAMRAIVGILPDFLVYNNVMAEVGAREEAIAAELGRARLEVYGTAVPPDATFSLRIADGVVEGYRYNGTEAPWYTTFFGLYDRHHSFPGREEWALPERWRGPPEGLDLATPLNFVSTVDIIGGNSGSPVLDRELEVVGVVFDGNIESLPGDYIYLPELNRSVAVDIRAVLEALRDVYGMGWLADELATGRLAGGR